jgi:hypothetical protein
MTSGSGPIADFRDFVVDAPSKFKAFQYVQLDEE